MRDQSVRRYLDELASAAPAPGGGAVAALHAAQAAALVGEVGGVPDGRFVQAVDAAAVVRCSSTPHTEERVHVGAQLAVVGIVVEDMARSLAFYRRLGLDIPVQADSEPHVEVSLPGGLKLAFDTSETIRSFDPSWAPPAGSPRMALAFGCDAPAEVDKLYGDLVAAGYEGHKKPWDAFWGMRYAIVHDPDGNGVDLFCPTPA